MIKLGHYNRLLVKRYTQNGAYLTDDMLSTEKDHEVLLPSRYLTETMTVGTEVDVFVYNDSEDRPTATTEKPFVVAGEFAFLQAADTNRIGAFMDWGLPKDLLVPMSQQKVKMKRGGIYLVYVYVDDASKRIVATAKTEKYLDNVFPEYREGQAVNALICDHTALGYSAIVNNLHRGMIYDNEIYAPVELQTSIRCYVKKVRDDGKVDLTLTAPGTLGRIDKTAKRIIELLSEGRFELTDKSSPEQIANTLQCSKKDFKKTLGALYRQGLVNIDKTDGKVTLK